MAISPNNFGDAFQRADTSAGSSALGPKWVCGANNRWNISSKKANTGTIPGSLGVAADLAVLADQTAVGDCEVWAKFTISAGNTAVVIALGYNAATGDSFGVYVFGTSQIAGYKRVSGTTTASLGTVGIAYSGLVYLQVIRSGSSLTAKLWQSDKKTQVGSTWTMPAGNTTTYAGGVGLAPYGMAVQQLVVDPVKVAALGDSNTLGYNGGTATTQFETQLISNGYKGALVWNYGVSGTASSDWTTGASTYNSAKADMLVRGITQASVNVGTNDSKTGVATSKATYKSRISALCSSLIADITGIGSIILQPGFSPVENAGTQWDAASPGLITQYNAALSELANGASIFYGSEAAWTTFQATPSNLSDKIHVTTDAPSLIVANAWESVAGAHLSGVVFSGVTIVGGSRTISDGSSSVALAATVQGTPQEITPQAVTWAKSSPTGPGASLFSIDSGGILTLPGQYSAPSTVTVTATAVDGVTSDSKVITIPAVGSGSGGSSDMTYASTSNIDVTTSWAAVSGTTAKGFRFKPRRGRTVEWAIASSAPSDSSIGEIASWDDPAVEGTCDTGKSLYIKSDLAFKLAVQIGA